MITSNMVAQNLMKEYETIAGAYVKPEIRIKIY